MPSYKVTAPGFHNSKYYSPGGKRRVLTTAKPFTDKNMPSWLAKMPKESPATAKKRAAREKESAKANADEVNQGSEDIANASFMGDGEASTSVVETI